MRYLRMLSNSLAVAMLGTCFVLTLVLQLNPTLPLHHVRLVPIAATVGAFYAFHLTVIFYIALIVRQLLTREVFSPGWLSVSVLTWFAAAASLAGAALMWANLRSFGLVLEPDTVRRMANGMLTLVMSSALFVFVALLRAHLGPAGGPCVARSSSWCGWDPSSGRWPSAVPAPGSWTGTRATLPPTSTPSSGPRASRSSRSMADRWIL